jgi:hypothetical protein
MDSGNEPSFSTTTDLVTRICLTSLSPSEQFRLSYEKSQP